MYEYTITSGTLKISTPFCEDLSAIKKEIIKQTAEVVISKFTYPNGFEYYCEVYSDKIVAKSNMKLIEIEPGVYEVEL